GVGMQYDKNRDLITILENATVHSDAAEGSEDAADGAMDVTAGSAAFGRRDRFLQFDRNVRIRRGAQTGQAGRAVAHLSADEKRIEALELHDHARITGTGGPGSLQALAGADMTLNYAADGRSLQHALIVGDAVAQLAGEQGKPGREIAAQTLEI